MQDRKLPVSSQLRRPSKIRKVRVFRRNKGKKTNYLGIFSLLASIGAIVSLSQPVQAKNTILNTRSETIVTLLPSLNNSSSDSQSVVVDDLSSIKSQSSTVSIQTEIKRSQIKEIPQLPALEVAQISQPVAVQIHRVKAGETIAQIARQYGVSAKQIIEANQLSNPNYIGIDRQLVIPNSELSSDRQSHYLKSESTSASGGVIPLNNSIKPLSSLGEKKAEFRNQKSTAITENRLSDRQDSSNTVTENSYISKLREGIIELRTRYQNQNGVGSTTVDTPITLLDNAVTETSPNTTPQVDALSEVENRPSNRTSFSLAATSATTNSPPGLSETNAITPALPPLAAPEEYLPNNHLFNGYIWPAQGTLSSGYGWRWGRMHKGIDIAAPIGTPIMAAASGEVIFAGWNSGGYGNLVKLQHSDGSVTFYAHNHRVVVHKGQKVKQGQLIAEMGSTGRSTGPHLHFEIRPNGTTAIDPIAHLPKSN